MKKTIDYYEFRDAFNNIRPNEFSRYGLTALFDYLEEMEEDLGSEFELDVIALCCDFVEMRLEGARSEYSYIDGIKEAGTLDEMADILRDHTTIIKTEGSTIIIGAF